MSGFELHVRSPKVGFGPERRCESHFEGLVEGFVLHGHLLMSLLTSPVRAHAVLWYGELSSCCVFVILRLLGALPLLQFVMRSIVAVLERAKVGSVGRMRPRLTEKSDAAVAVQQTERASSQVEVINVIGVWWSENQMNRYAEGALPECIKESNVAEGEWQQV